MATEECESSTNRDEGLRCIISTNETKKKNYLYKSNLKIKIPSIVLRSSPFPLDESCVHCHLDDFYNWFIILF